MSTRQTLKRIERLERLMCPQEDGAGKTLDQLCRECWKEDKTRFTKLGKSNSYYRKFVERFRQEDANAASNARQRYRR